MSVLTQRRKSDEDLFNETTMTFGEHLEELRVCLWKATLGLMLGFCLGLMVGKPAMLMIQEPLTRALDRYYSTLTIDRIKEDVANQQSILAASGVTYDPMVLEKMFEAGVIFEVKFVERTELRRALGLDVAKPAEDAKGAEGAKGPEAAAPVPSATAAPTATAVPSAAPAPSAASTPTAAPSATGEPVETDDKKLTPEQIQAAEAKVAGLVPLLIWQAKKDDDRTRPTTLNAQEAFMMWFKASFVVGALISAPWVFYQIWNFVASGLYRHERKYVYTFLPFSLGLFFLGAATAYIFVFEPVLDFLFSFNAWLGIHPDPRINEWIGFVLLLPLGFGVSFQLPLVMLFLERIGIFQSKDFIEKWRIAVLAIFVISAVLTPADPYSIFFMAVPLTFLYFGGILLTKYLPKGGRPAASLP